MFPVTITIKNATQLNAVMAILDPDNNEYARQKAIASEPKSWPMPNPDAPKAEPKAEVKADPKPAAAAASAEAQAQTAPAATTAESRSEPVVIGDVNAAIIALAKAKGRDAAVALLGTFGAAKAPELKPEQYADVVAAAKKAMA
jgi:hypothetical protein